MCEEEKKKGKSLARIIKCWFDLQTARGLDFGDILN
jgi:hypothetical protein